MRRLDLGQPRLIDLRVERLERNRMNDALRSAPGPAIGERLRELRDFVGKLHDLRFADEDATARLAKKNAAVARSGETRREDGTPNEKN